MRTRRKLIAEWYHHSQTGAKKIATKLCRIIVQESSRSCAIYSHLARVAKYRSPHAVDNYFIAIELRTKCDIRANVAMYSQLLRRIAIRSLFSRYSLVNSVIACSFSPAGRGFLQLVFFFWIRGFRSFSHHLVEQVWVHSDEVSEWLHIALFEVFYQLFVHAIFVSG